MCSSAFIMSMSSSSKFSDCSGRGITVSTVDVHKYIDAIEEQLLREGEKTFTARLRYQNKKPIIRALVDIQTKEEFDKLLRMRQKQAEYNKMKDFCIKNLQPRIHNLPSDQKEKVPDFDAALEVALGKPIDKGIQTFNRLASGRVYKGRLIDLVKDLVPDETQNCLSSMTPLSEDEALIQTIDVIADDNKSFDRKNERIKAAKNCINFFQSYSNGYVNNNADPASSKVNGLECEQACLDWLNVRRNGKGDEVNCTVLANVMINNFGTKSRQKYFNNQFNPNGAQRNIMWTDTVRNGITSEFDAVILQMRSPSSSNNVTRNEEVAVTMLEIWEAKYSMSPSSLHDVLTKKVPAIRALREDKHLSISFDGNCHSLYSKSRNDFVLGVFGSELLPPEHAIGQLKSTAVSYALSTNIDIAMDNAIKSGVVELSVDVLLHDVNHLRHSYIEASKHFDIIIRTANPC